MIDLHSHIIYGVDDGSVDAEMSLEMLRMAAANGTTEIFCTPHVIELKDRPSWPLIQERAAELQAMADREGLQLKVHTGAEMMMNWDMLKVYKEAPHAYCLEGTAYALVEMPMLEVPMCADDFWYQLQLMGKTPILAHPERYPSLSMDILLKWMSRGVLTQINGGSLIGKFGELARERAKEMLSNNMVTFMGSDAHRVNARTTDLSEALEALIGLVGEAKAREITEANPKDLLADRLIEMQLPKELYGGHDQSHSHSHSSEGKKKKGFFSRIFG